MKRKLGFMWSAQSFAGLGPSLYLWTFTFVERIEVEEATDRWNVLLTVLRREHGERWSGFRAYEMHPGGHGLHIHAVVDERFSAGQMWKVARSCRFGRVDVKEIPVRGAAYLAKYLGKKRPLELKNKRLLAPFGNRARACWHRIKDVEVQSPWIQMHAALKALIPDFADFSFRKRCEVVRNGLRRAAGVRGSADGPLWALDQWMSPRFAFVDS